MWRRIWYEFAAENYNMKIPKNLNNAYSHLTNYSLNLHSKQFNISIKNSIKDQNELCHPWYKSLAGKGINVEELKKKLKVLAINTGKTIYPT